MDIIQCSHGYTTMFREMQYNALRDLIQCSQDVIECSEGCSTMFRGM